MKKTTLMALFLAGLAFASCKKKYTCECVTTDKDSSGGTVDTYTYPAKSTAYSSKMTKKQAQSACDHEAEAIHSSYDNWWTENGTAPVYDFSTSTTCTLK